MNTSSQTFPLDYILMIPMKAGRAAVFAALVMGPSAQANGQGTGASAALRAFLGTANPIVAEATPIRRATVRESANLVAETHSREAARPMMATQWDKDGDHPMAQLGDTLFAFNERDRSSTALIVVARARFRAATGYDGGIDYAGWGYALDGKADSLFDAVRGGEGYFMYPWRLPRKEPALATAAERRSLASVVRPPVAAAAERAAKMYSGTTSYGSASQIRRKIIGATGLGTFGDTERTRVYVVHGPGNARLLFTSASLDDDLSDHGQETVLTLLTGDGQATVNSSVRYDVLVVTDLDHDGIDEIVTRQGVIRWTGHEWAWPSRRDALPR